MKKTVFYFMLLSSLLCSFLAWSKENVLRVGVVPGEPFVIVSHEGNQDQYQGIAINIWQMIAKNLNLQYEYILVGENIDDNIKRLANHEFDVLIGTVIPTEDRILLVDFTQPYYLNQIGMVIEAQEIPFLTVLSSILTGSFDYFILFILILFIVYIHVFWYFERDRHYMGVESTYWPGIATAFWLNTLDISFEQVPPHPWTRRIRFGYFIVLPLLLSLLYAAVTSSLTVTLENKYTQYNKLSDFDNQPVTAVSGTIPYALAADAGLRVVPSHNREDAMNLLLNRKVAGYMDYYPIAEYYIRKHQLENKLMLADFIVEQNLFAFAVPFGSPLRHQIDLALHTLEENGQLKFMCEKLLGGVLSGNCQI